MGFSDQYRIAHVHIPKCAGFSICKALWPMGHAEWHYTALELQKADPVRWAGYKKLAVVRNPWDRIVSLYTWQHEAKDGSIKRDRDEDLSFRDWIWKIFVSCECVGEIRHGKPWMLFWFQQWRWLCDNDGKLIMDTVLKFEDLRDGWYRLMELDNLPQLPCLNVSASRRDDLGNVRPYREYYDAEIFEALWPWVQKDCKMFGYLFGD